MPTLLVCPAVTPSMRLRQDLERRLGEPVHWVRTARSAQRRLRDARIDLVVLAQGVEGAEGIFEEARRLHPGIPVVVAAAGADLGRALGQALEQARQQALVAA